MIGEREGDGQGWCYTPVMGGEGWCYTPVIDARGSSLVVNPISLSMGKEPSTRIMVAISCSTEWSRGGGREGLMVKISCRVRQGVSE